MIPVKKGIALWLPELEELVRHFVMTHQPKRGIMELAIDRSNGFWQSPHAAILADASRYYLKQSVIDANNAARHLVTLSGYLGITREQARRLRCLASAAAMAAEGAERLFGELKGS